MRLGLTASLLAALALALPASALAHARLERAVPGFRERVAEAPRAVVLHFDQAVEPVEASVDVRTAGGRRVSGQARVDQSGRVIRAPLRRLAKGPYTVRWRALSTDGHVVAGVYTFGVRYPAPPPTEAFGAGGPTRSEDVVRWVYFLALALLAGGLAFRLLVAREPLPRRAERRFYLLTGAGVVGVLELGIVAFLLRADDVLQLPFRGLLYGDLSPIAQGTRFGSAFIAMTLGFALVAALLYLAWLTERRILLWPALALSLAFAAGLSLSGHSADGSWRDVLADWVHLSAAMLWLGGLATMAIVIWPAAPALRRPAFLRFSRLASALIALILAAGLYLTIARLPALTDLWTTPYGRILLVKLGLVSLALLWGAFHHFAVRPVLERPGSDRLVARLSRSLAGESAVGTAILLVAAVLVNAAPPPG